jgi:UDP-glucose 4-epimerase
MRILVTGGLGFTGRAVTRSLLQHGHDVTVLTSHPDPAGDATRTTGSAALIRDDLRDAGSIRGIVGAGEFEAVCHLAALTRVRDSFANPIGYYDVNVAGTVHLLAALDAHAAATLRPARVVFASTAAVYGPADGRLREDQPTRPTNPYGSSKLAAERLLTHQAATGRLTATTLRCFNIAGGFDGQVDPDTTRIIPKALAVANGGFDAVQVNGDGSALREYTHVLDVADAFRLALDHPPDEGGHRVYNVGTGQGISVTEVVEAVRRITGCAVPVEHLGAKPEPQILVSDNTRIREELGWQPRHSTLDEVLNDGWAALHPAVPPNTR